MLTPVRVHQLSLEMGMVPEDAVQTNEQEK